jgi:hypothetical protein
MVTIIGRRAAAGRLSPPDVTSAASISGQEHAEWIGAPPGLVEHQEPGVAVELLEHLHPGVGHALQPITRQLADTNGYSTLPHQER